MTYGKSFGIGTRGGRNVTEYCSLEHLHEYLQVRTLCNTPVARMNVSAVLLESVDQSLLRDDLVPQFGGQHDRFNLIAVLGTVLVRVVN